MNRSQNAYIPPLFLLFWLPPYFYHGAFTRHALHVLDAPELGNQLAVSTRIPYDPPERSCPLFSMSDEQLLGVEYSDSRYSRPWMPQMSPDIADKPIIQPAIPFTTLFQLNSKKTEQQNTIFTSISQKNYMYEFNLFSTFINKFVYYRKLQVSGFTYLFHIVNIYILPLTEVNIDDAFIQERQIIVHLSIKKLFIGFQKHSRTSRRG